MLALVAFAQTTKNVESPNGYNIFYYPNGKIASEGNMHNSRPDGFWKSYYPTGVLKAQGNRLNALLDSTWIFFSETADTLEILNYRLGKKSGYQYKYKSTVVANSTAKNYLFSKELFLDDMREGIAYTFFPNGNIQFSTPYKKNKRQGTAYEYDANGLIITIFEYHNDYLISREYINRTDSDGRKVGTWKSFHPNGTLHSEQHFKNDTLVGNAKTFSDKGVLLSNITYQQGQIVADNKKLSSEAMEIITFYDDSITPKRRGIFIDSIPIGAHIFYDKNGLPERSVRFSQNGVAVAQGPVDQKQKRTGRWQLLYPDGKVRAEGNFLNDRQHGTWNFFFDDGRKEQEGDFDGGQKVGTWKWFYRNGNLHKSETYVANKLSGDFTQYSDSATVVAHGQYENNEKTGYWRENIGDCSEEGEYSRGLKVGTWKTFYRSGKLHHSGDFKDGNPDGKHLFYHPNGFVAQEQHYAVGRKDKTWKKYHENGALFITITYRNDREIRINGQNIK